MRSVFLVVIACLLYCLVPAWARAQQLQCNPCDVHFGKVSVGSSVSYDVQLSNVGDKPLRITSKSEEGRAFSLGNFPLPIRLRPGQTVQLPVIFTPTAKGITCGVITLQSTAKDRVLTIDVAGTGVYPELRVKPSRLRFGNVTVGSSATLQVMLSAWNDAVTISSDRSTSSEFAILGPTLPAEIQPGQSIPVTIQFTPNSSGTSSARVGFFSNAEVSPTVEQLMGTGVAESSHHVYLSWDPSAGNPVGYNVYRGTAQAGPFTRINTALDASTNYTDYAVDAGSTYYYVTTAVNAEGQESAYSNVAQAVIAKQ